MTDRDRYQLHGPVQSVRTEFASVNPESSEWDPFRQGPTITFDREGRHDLPGRTTRTIFETTFDERGLRTTISSRGPAVPRPPGLEYGLGMKVGQLHDVLTRYDEDDRPVEIVDRDAEGKTIYRTLLSYDRHGRLHREEVRHGERLGDSFHTTDSSAQPPTADEIEAFKTRLTAFLRDRVFLSMEYTYDEGGRVAHLVKRMGGLSEETQSFTYDGHDNVLEGHLESIDRDGNFDDEGTLVASTETASESWGRYEYRYDERGNWIEKVALRRESPDGAFHRSSIERRTITYCDSPDQTSNSASDQA